MEKVGIDYMTDYIEKSLLEHSLCLKFKEEIEAILEGFHKGYRDLLVNIFELVLMNAIGRLILKKDLSSLYLQVTGTPQAIFLHCLPAVKGNEVSEDVMYEAILFAHKEIIKICEFIDDEVKSLIENYKKANYQVIEVSSHNNINIEEVAKVINNKKNTTIISIYVKPHINCCEFA